LGIRPNGDVTPCPYLPVYGGNLRNDSLSAIWHDSDVFRRIRQRDELGGRCGPCEFHRMCGGCRARAFGLTGDIMAEDPWCTYQPGRHGGDTIAPPRDTYGEAVSYSLQWTPSALETAERIPGFVRGKVIQATEDWAREHGFDLITPDVMHRARVDRLGGRVANVPEFVRGLMSATAQD
jgi:radical SAM protein with 4Fe4S-binding SPASM domain